MPIRINLHSVLLLGVLFLTPLFSFADTHTMVNSGAWNVAGNWSPAAIPAIADNVIIPSGKNCTGIGTTARTCATLQVDGSLSVSGRNLTVTNTISGTGSITVTGRTFTIGGGSFSGTITVSSSTSSAFIISTGTTFTNNGTITVNYIMRTNGTLINNNIIDNNNNSQVYGTITNNGTYNENYLTKLYNSTSLITNNSGKNFTISTTGQLYLYWGTFINDGTLTNNCPISLGFPGILIDVAATLTNNNSLINNGTLSNYTGIIDNYGTITNNDTIRNLSTSSGSGQINIYSGSTLDNNCKIHNSYYNTSIFSFITINSGGTLNNNGIVKNLGGYIDVFGTLTNNGTYLEWGVTRLQNGSVFTNNANRCIYTDTYLIGGSYYIGIIYILSGATLTNNGTIQNNSGDTDPGPPLNILWYGILTDGTGGTINNNDTINNNGIMYLDAGAVYNNNSIFNENSFTVFDNSTCNNYGTYNENFETFLENGCTFNNKSGANVNISASSLFCFNGTTAGTLTNDNGGTVTNMGVGSLQGLYLAIASAAITNNGTIIDQGNILNNGTITNNSVFDYYMTTGSITGSNLFTYGSSGTLIYHGSTAQTTSNYEFISGGVPNVTINNNSGSGVVLHDSRTVSLLLTLSDGPLNLNENTLTITNSAGNAVTRTSGYILSDYLDKSFNSKVQWNIGSTTGAHEFPFGLDVSNYIPFTFNLTSGGPIGNVTISTYEAGTSSTTASDVYNNRPTIVTNLDGEAGTGNPGNAENIVKRFWNIEPSGSGTATITFSYPEEEIPVNDEITNDMWAQRYITASNSWDAPLASQSSNTSLNTVTVTGVTAFSPWAISRRNFYLPVELINFNAICNESDVDIFWSTVSETNNDFFTVEKSKDAYNFEPVAFVDGAGNSNELLQYSTNDFEPFEGISYYRLKQTDFNGQYTYSDIVPVNYFNDNNTSISWWQEGSILNLNIQSSYVGEGMIDVYDYSGKLVLCKNIFSENSQIIISFETSNYKSGIYILKFELNGKQYVKKVVIV